MTRPLRLGLSAGAATIDASVELGVGGVPIDAAALVSQGVEPTLAPLDERGLSVCQIGAFGYNPLSPDADALAKQTQLLRDVIPLATTTGCPYIVINGGNYHPSAFGGVDVRNYTNEALEHVARALAPLLSLAEEHGACLSIEPYLKTAVHSAESFLRLYALVCSDALRINIDPTSLYDYWDLVDPRGRVDETCTLLAGHYGLVHIKEVALSESFHLHAGLAPLGQGNTDWAQMLSLVAPHVPEDSWVVLEHVESADEARASYRILMNAASRAGVALA